MNKTVLMQALIELVESEKKYKEWYETEEVRLITESDTKKYSYKLDNFYHKNRTPNKATSKDALRLIARLGYQIAKEL